MQLTYMCYHQISWLFLIMFSIGYVQLAWIMGATSTASWHSPSVTRCVANGYGRSNWHKRCCQLICQSSTLSKSLHINEMDRRQNLRRCSLGEHRHPFTYLDDQFLTLRCSGAGWSEQAPGLNNDRQRGMGSTFQRPVAARGVAKLLSYEGKQKAKVSRLILMRK
jgi:hypothetical protein